jgi:hypothetical protein
MFGTCTNNKDQAEERRTDEDLVVSVERSLTLKTDSGCTSRSRNQVMLFFKMHTRWRWWHWKNRSEIQSLIKTEEIYSKAFSV